MQPIFIRKFNINNLKESSSIKNEIIVGAFYACICFKVAFWGYFIRKYCIPHQFEELKRNFTFSATYFYVLQYLVWN